MPCGRCRGVHVRDVGCQGALFQIFLYASIASYSKDERLRILSCVLQETLVCVRHVSNVEWAGFGHGKPLDLPPTSLPGRVGFPA